MQQCNSNYLDCVTKTQIDFFQIDFFFPSHKHQPFIIFVHPNINCRENKAGILGSVKNIFRIIMGNYFMRHYWGYSALASSPSGGVVITSPSRFTRRVPLKESMLRHIRKSSRLIKPLIFCDAGALLNTVYRDSQAGKRTQCVFYRDSPNTEEKVEALCSKSICMYVYVCGYFLWHLCILEKGKDRDRVVSRVNRRVCECMHTSVYG